MRFAFATAVLIAGLSASVASCALSGFDKVPYGSGGGGAGDGCNHAVAPSRPTIADAGGSLDLVFAMHSVDFGEDQPLADRPGLDLDAACTCEDAMAAQCVLPTYAVADMRCDSADGRDNATADLIGFIKKNTGSGSKQFSDSMAVGKWSILIRVTGYDGTPNDSKVSVALYMTPGLAPAVANWDGQDTWPIRAESFSATDPIILDKEAYVANGELVSLVTGELRLDGDLSVRIGSGRVMAKLVHEGTAWKLQDGLIAGTWEARDALAGIGNLLYLGMKVCDTFVYPGAHSAICDRVDIASAPSLPCDSLSFGMRFSADAAILGMTLPAEVVPPPCKVDQCG